jgi:transcriptional regulator with XRE-family HTH domain
MRLADFMSTTGVSCASLARATNVSRSTISRLKNGKSKPSMSLARRIELATALAVGMSDWEEQAQKDE